MKSNIKHLDGIKLNKENPKTFHIPTDLEKSEIKIGDFIKIGFVEEGVGTERMWIKVTGKGIGELNNDPLMINMSCGETVEFKDSEVLNIMKD